MLSGKPYKVRINKYSQIKQAVASILVYRGYSIECVPMEMHYAEQSIEKIEVLNVQGQKLKAQPSHRRK